MKRSAQPHKVSLTCPLCGAAKRAFDEGTASECGVCGRTFEADAICANGHCVCPLCRQKAARADIVQACLSSKETDPYALMLDLMRLPATAMHGPEHHLLLPAALLTALCNVKARTDLAALLEEADRRSLQVPGGACGHWGICGAAIGAGIFSSLLLQSSPFAESAWKACGQLTSKCGDSISEQGGPRCCKRDCFTALPEATDFSNQMFGTDFPAPDDIVCSFFLNNRECKGVRCRFFPGGGAV